MALLDRFTRLLRADVHAVLDRLEEPETLLRQALREMDEEVAQAAAALQAQETQQRFAQQRRREIETALSKLAAEIDLAFAANNENLVRSLLRRRLEHERLAQQLDQRLGALDADLTQRRDNLSEQRQRLESLQQKAALFDTPSATAPCTPLEATISEADVELALLRERQQRVVS